MLRFIPFPNEQKLFRYLIKKKIIYTSGYVFPQPNHSTETILWHKVGLFAEYILFEFRGFPSTRPVDIVKLKSPLYFTVVLLMMGKEMDMFLLKSITKETQTGFDLVLLYIYIYMCVCLCVCVCVCTCTNVCVYLGSISSLIYISLNNIDILCLEIFVYIPSSCRIDFMVSSGNWLIKLLKLISSQVFSADLEPSSGCVIWKSNMTFVWKLLLCKCLLIILVWCCSVYL